MFSSKIPKRSELRCAVNRWIQRTQVWVEKHRSSRFWMGSQPGARPPHRLREALRTCPRSNVTKCQEGRAAVASGVLPAEGEGQRKRKAGAVEKRTTLPSEDLFLERREAGTKGGGNKGVSICRIACLFFPFLPFFFFL